MLHITDSMAMKQWTTNEDGLENLKLGTAPVPSPGPDDVLVKINAVSINYRDTEVIMGLYNHHKSISTLSSLVPCSDICGEIVSLGSETNARGFHIGDRVLSIFNQTHLDGQIQAEDMTSGLGKPLPGVLCEYRCFPVSGLVTAPDYLSDVQASTLPIAGVTAWMAINGMRQLGQWGGKGEVVLIQGTGGVAINGLLIAKAAGATGS
jgi:NADPH:quinone reductase-like Zn-dependent oxidoreductase